MPAVPPCSSTTMASGVRVLWKRCRATSMLEVSAMKPMGRSRRRRVASRGARYRSLTWT